MKSRLTDANFESESVKILPWGNFSGLDTFVKGADGAVVGVVCGGTLRLTVGGTQYNLKENQMFILHNDANLTRVKPSKACCGYIILVKNKYLTMVDVPTSDYMIADLKARTTPVFDVGADVAGSMHEVVVNMVDAARHTNLAFIDGVLNSLVGAFFYIAMSVISAQETTEVVQQRHRIEKTEEYMSQFVELLSQEHERERSVEYYAKRLGITPKYLTIICRKYRGKTASRVIDDVVIHNAMRLLKQHGVSVQQVSERLNFPSQSFFGKFFKQRVGISPSRYKGQSN